MLWYIVAWLRKAIEFFEKRRRGFWKVLIPGRSLKKSRRWEPIDFTGLKLTTPFQKLPNAFFSLFLLPIHCQKPEIGWAMVVVQFTKSELLFFSFFPFWENEIKTIFRSPEDSSGIALHEQSSQTISSCKIE